MNPVESKWDRSKRLEQRFEAWCRNVAAALGGAVEAPRVPENVTRWNTVRLPDGLSFDLHLVGYESRVAVSGNWPKNARGQSVIPRDAIRYDTEAAKIYVGAEREPAAVAKDIARRFLPVYREQHAACLERVGRDNAYQDKVTANTRRLAAALGIAENDKHRFTVTDGRGQLFTDLSGLAYKGVTVSGDAARFEIDLPIEQAEQVLRILKQLAAKETEGA